MTAINHHKGSKILLLGDSITEGFDTKKLLPDMDILNMGISGSSTDELLLQLKIEWFDPAPDHIVLCIGTNDIARNTAPQLMLSNTNQLLHLLRKYTPKSRLYLVSLFPTRHNTPRPNKKITIYNSLLHSLAVENDIVYLHFNPFFASSDQSLKMHFTDDGLHLNEQSYNRWAILFSMIFE